MEGKGWHRDTPGHKEAAIKAAIKGTLKDTLREPMIMGAFETIYRGEGATSKKGGRYWSPSMEWAKQFTQTGRVSEVYKAFIKTSQIYTAKELPYAGDPDEIDKAIAFAKSKGYKAVRLSEGQNEPSSVYVFDQSTLKSITKLQESEG